jgi:pimeloyl-ACP methyl ester carboxylesterase
MCFTSPVTQAGVSEVVRTVPGAGIDLSVAKRGDRSNPTVVLIHGFPDTRTVWTPLVELLATDFHVVTYDVRGAGRSGVPLRRADYALPLLVEDLAAVIDDVSPGTPVHLVAHDWGSIQGWEAVTSVRLAGRIASYTSISGPPIEHAALWARSHMKDMAGLRMTLRQALHSWYIAFFHLPGVPRLATRGTRNQRMWGRALHRMEGAQPDATWPAETFGSDFAHGVELYRANIARRFRHPVRGHTDTPVQIVVPTNDRYITPAMLLGLEAWSPLVWRREVDAAHWVIRTRAADVARWVREVIAFVEDGSEAPGLKECRVSG